MSQPMNTYLERPEDRPLASNAVATDFGQGNPTTTSPLAQQMSSPPAGGILSGGSSVAEDGHAGADGTISSTTTAVQTSAPARSNTLKKNQSLRRSQSNLKRSGSRKSSRAGSMAGLGDGHVDSSADYNSVFSTPIPTQGTPTEILANRFQSWRQLLKTLIAYFREIQASYETRAKATQKLQHVMAGLITPSVFMKEHGLGEATKLLTDYHKRSVAEANKSREIEEDVIGALSGLRSDLGQKIKEIKSLNSDFKNSVDKEKENTKREVEKLQEALQLAERDDGSAIGKNDPFVVKLGVDRAVERQIDEENYLHRAYLNLESSGRELESIVVGEIQKAYNALAGILKREGDDAYTTVESLRSGPISMPKEAEWLAFVEHDAHFVDPSLPLRRVEDMEYPGKHDPAGAEVRAGMLERKSKYLKSYTPGWYVLSSTHLHEFKSADNIYSQPPVMSLYLPDQKLGSHSQIGSSSHKFMVKGKQSGNMHKGHNWVFRAESYDTMLAWFEDMRALTMKTGEERTAFVRKHARSFSANSRRASISSDGMEEDEADQVPYSADASVTTPLQETKPQRPQPGGRFPSDLNIQRARGESVGQDSGSSEPEPETVAMIGGTPFTYQPQATRFEQDPYRLSGVTAGTNRVTSYGFSGAANDSYFDETPGATPRPETSGTHTRETSLAASWMQQPTPMVQHDGTANGVSPLVETALVGAGAGAGATYLATSQNGEREVNGAQSHDDVLAASEIPVEPKSIASDIPVEPKSTPEVKPAALMPETTLIVEPMPIIPIENEDETPAVATGLPTDGPIGGLEAEGARETGQIFPTVLRHSTQMSVSQLHVPGDFPKVE